MARIRAAPFELLDLLPQARDELDGGLHFRHHPLGFLDALHAGLAEPFVLGNSANLLDVRLDISGNELAVTTYPTLEIDKMIGMADATDALCELLTLLGEALLLTPCRFEHLLAYSRSRAPLGGDLDRAFGRVPAGCRGVGT